jgi:thioesterase domain-containing protein
LQNCSESVVTSATSALFARLPLNSERAIVPLNDCALAAESNLPAFYCVHSASGVAGADFLDLAKRLDPLVRFYGVQAPPRQMSNAEFGKSVESIADYYCEALLKFQPSGRFLLGGYCLGAVIALAMADNLRRRGREIGLLVVIDGVPENTGVALRRWSARYAIDLLRNARGWVSHADLMRNRNLRSLLWSISNNASAIGRGALGLRKGQKLSGGYSIERIMDISRYPPAHKSFINRLFNALFAYSPAPYGGEVVVYEATVKPLLSLPQIGNIWQKFAVRAQLVEIVGTHISMMHEPYVDALAQDLRRRLADRPEH